MEAHFRILKKGHGRMARFWSGEHCRTQEKKLQIPEAFQIKSLPYASEPVSDQGGINRAGLDYLVYKLSLALCMCSLTHTTVVGMMSNSALKSVPKEICTNVFSAHSHCFINVNYGPLRVQGVVP